MHLARVLIYPARVHTARHTRWRAISSAQLMMVKWSVDARRDESELAYRRKWYAWNQSKKQWWGDRQGVRCTTPAGSVSLSPRGGAAGCVRRAAAPLAKPPARISIQRTAPHFAKPSVMQGAPLPIRCSLHRAGRKSGTRRSGAAARAASARPRLQWSASSVVTVSLLERWIVLRKSYAYGII